MTEKKEKKFKNLTGFHSVNKTDNYNRGERGENPKESTEQIKK